MVKLYKLERLSFKLVFDYENSGKVTETLAQIQVNIDIYENWDNCQDYYINPDSELGRLR